MPVYPIPVKSASKQEARQRLKENSDLVALALLFTLVAAAWSGVGVWLDGFRFATVPLAVILTVLTFAGLICLIVLVALCLPVLAFFGRGLRLVFLAAFGADHPPASQPPALASVATTDPKADEGEGAADSPPVKPGPRSRTSPLAGE